MRSVTLAITTALAVGVFAQDSASLDVSTGGSTPSATTSAPSAAESAQTTLAVFIGSMTTGYAARIVAANACETTIAVSCTADSFVCSQAENLGLDEQTVTQGPSTYRGTHGLSTDGVEATATLNCDFEGPSGSPTYAVCTETGTAAIGGSSTVVSEVVTYNEAEIQATLNWAQIPITAGAEMLPSGSAATCLPTSSPEAAAPTGIVVEIYKVMVPVGAVLAAGALM